MVSAWLFRYEDVFRVGSEKATLASAVVGHPVWSANRLKGIPLIDHLVERGNQACDLHVCRRHKWVYRGRGLKLIVGLLAMAGSVFPDEV